jgi:hypothetical protein
MKIRFYASGKAYDQSIAKAIMNGLAQAGERDVLTVSNDVYDPDVDIAIIVGVKNSHIMEQHLADGKRVVYIDKPYDRSGDSYRVSFDGHQPTDYLMNWQREGDRLELLGWKAKSWRQPTVVDPILIAGSSAKYHQMKDLADPTVYATGIVEDIRSIGCCREIVYRPKPSWKGAVDITGTRRSVEKRIADELRHSFVLITYGSNSCFDALIEGVPSIVLGDGVTRDVSSTSLLDLEEPKRASPFDKYRLLCNLAYCQWKYYELEDGTFWRFARGELDCLNKG